LKTVVSKLNPTRVKLEITVEPADFKPALDQAYKTVAQQINIPGFRKGHVPAPVIDQRVGRGAVLAQAINDSLDNYYRQAIKEENLRPLDTPQADVKQAPDEKTLEGNLVIEIEVELRPEFSLPEYKGLKAKVDSVKVAKMDVESELDALRARFGTLKVVERPAQRGDFTSIDLSAVIDGKTIDTATDISYEIGSGQLLDGIDDALETLTAGETTTFKSKLVGGDQAGAEAEVTVKLNAVKERELPEANDEFAQLASEFDTLEELKKDIETKLGSAMVRKQLLQARDVLVDQLIAAAKIPVSDVVIKREVESHLEGEGRQQDDEHRKEVTEESTKGFQSQLLLDAIAEKEDIKVEDQELIEYLAQASRSYGMDPNDFIRQVADAGQVPVFVSDLARRKAVDLILAQAEVSDSEGKKVEVSA
jgi:trigger factor